MTLHSMLPTDADQSIAAEAYPLTTEDLIDRYGDRELLLPNGSECVADVLERLGDETYDSPDEVRTALYNGVSHAAVGRRFYSDRDPTPPGAPFGHQQLSF